MTNYTFLTPPSSKMGHIWPILVFFRRGCIQLFVCARPTLARWIGLGEKLPKTLWFGRNGRLVAKPSTDHMQTHVDYEYRIDHRRRCATHSALIKTLGATRWHAAAADMHPVPPM